MKTEEIERLRQFFGAYFHQDWRLDARDEDGIVDRFVADASDKATLTSLAALIDAFRESQPDEVQLERALHIELWCEFVLNEAGISTSAWLRHVSARLRKATE